MRVIGYLLVGVLGIACLFLLTFVGVSSIRDLWSDLTTARWQRAEDEARAKAISAEQRRKPPARGRVIYDHEADETRADQARPDFVVGWWKDDAS
jgi:hypothetical protein